MFPELRRLNADNDASETRISDFQSAIKVRGARPHQIFTQYRRDYPYYGYVPIRETGVPIFFMFNNNDDIVAQHYMWFGLDGYEPTAVTLWKGLCKEAACIVDIGAFSGLFTLLARRINQSATVVAVEPLKPAFDRLLINLRVNRLFKTVQCINLGMSKECKRVEFHYFRESGILQTGASYIRKPGLKSFFTETAEVIIGDDLMKREKLRPSVLKIDVEQAEVDVLTGLRETILEYRPHVICEISPSSASVVWEYFREKGYSCYIIDEAQREISRHESVPTILNVENAYFAP